MRDPYLYDDVDVLRNLLGIKDHDKLEQAEADITNIRILTVDGAVAHLPFSLSRILAIHKHIFGDIYEWAGKLRVIPIVKGERILGGDTVKYSLPKTIKKDCANVVDSINKTAWDMLGAHETAKSYAKSIAALWQVHPFREGNTRTTITYATQYAEAHGFRMDKTLLKDNAAYVRDALVKASDDMYSDHKYLTEIFEDAIRRG